MRRLQSLIDVTRYVRGFRLEKSGIVPLCVTDEKQAVSRLINAAGIQVLVARPELSQDGNSDTYTESISTAFFIIEKSLGADRTDIREDGQFETLADVADEVLTKLERDAGNFDNPYLKRLSLAVVEVVPEYNIFGGWNGYSVEVTFR